MPRFERELDSDPASHPVSFNKLQIVIERLTEMMARSDKHVAAAGKTDVHMDGMGEKRIERLNAVPRPLSHQMTEAC